ncbi:thermonuclease family protein [Rodentibacter trehalosifermentans]|uniref:Nuclease n=1 Tax=Rodentibacter trehalosifermentans TaxID=1908263 RepID=A0A1V3IU76_9PAST|nr:thermonuclease family protein [Rodentibacter trehalosifermentans]OOF45676.1 nuclease [Rodentibacter trehalosifermentans]OOF48585.1 nuclease [Rodentibacter trehalosifermentans]OOF52608.1 nuclease [Rodentibacter trehalosifermentans]
MIKNIIILISLLFLTALSAHSRPLKTCLVVAISDGDTITCLMRGNKPVKVRLADIDAPERHQPFGKKAKQRLSAFIYKQRVSLKITGQDRYKRTLATVYYNGKNINLEMVKSGMAWAYHHALNHSIYLQAQQTAKTKRLGLWADRFPTPPYQWRKQERKYGF